MDFKLLLTVSFLQVCRQWGFQPPLMVGLRGYLAIHDKGGISTEQNSLEQHFNDKQLRYVLKL